MSSTGPIPAADQRGLTPAKISRMNIDEKIKVQKFL
jgi:hypothetical protein